MNTMKNLSDIITIPDNLNKIRDYIHRNYTELSTLPDNWDDEGASVVNNDILTTALKFVVRIFSIIGEKDINDYVYPDINPCHDGTVDISYLGDYKRYTTLLINFRYNKDNQIIGSYYGDNRSDDFIKGKFLIDNIPEEIYNFIRNGFLD